MNGQPHSAHAQSADLQTGADLIRKRSHHSQLTSGDPDRYVVKKSTTGTSDIGRLALSFARDGRICAVYILVESSLPVEPFDEVPTGTRASLILLRSITHTRRCLLTALSY